MTTLDAESEPPTRARSAWAVLSLVVAALAAATGAGAAPAARPLQTAIVDPYVFTGPDAAAGLARAAAAGVTAIKVPLFWNGVAPARPPREFRSADPSDPAYNWAALDTQLRLIRAHGLEPIVYVAGAPDWALKTIDGARRPDPAQVQAFTLAAVRRYSGRTAGLPRVRYWQAWNEPNKVVGPEAKNGTEDWYRTLVNRFADSAHSVRGNVVIAGALAPFGISTAIAPFAFMRELLSKKVHFDVWAIDPYTAGGPSHEPPHPNDVSVARLPEMKRVLDTAVKAGDIVSTRPVGFWVTEFAWDSNPPDPGGVPIALEGRWVAESLYRMWSSGVSLVTWFTLRDQPFATSAYQSGLYFLGSTFAHDRPKPALTAFRFPFVAYPAGKNVSVWGRTPTSGAGAVVVEQRAASTWAVVARLHADSAGIFSALVRPVGTGPLRARLAAAKAMSLPFSLVSPPDHPYVPFGAPVPNASGGVLSNAAVSQYVEKEPTAAAAPAAPGTRMRTLLLVAALATILLVLAAAAFRRRHPGTVQPRH
jgi:hypothetical protein